MSILGFIPARGGSKRVPRTNIRDLCGRPLIAWTIQAARDARTVDRVVVSTDDGEIADVAQEWGAEVVTRPAGLATDGARTEDAMIHTLQELSREGYFPQVTVLLQPTSPLRSSQRIDSAVALFRQTGGPTVLSVTGICDHVFNGRLKDTRFLPNYDINHRPLSQDYEPLYRENGAVYVTDTRTLLSRRNRLAEPMYAVVMSEMESIDIDSEEDLVLAGRVMNALEMSAGYVKETV